LSHCQSLLMVDEPLGFCWGSPCLCLLLPLYSPLFPLLASVFQVWY
jgi:hypothetical protein